MWIVERLDEESEWRVIARCEKESDADIVVAALKLANPITQFRKREETGE